MANRVSEAAPAPPPAKTEPAPAPVSTRSPAAQKMGIPDFAQEMAPAATVELAWNDYDAEDGGGMPTGDGPKVNVEGTNAEGEVGRPKRGGKTNVNVAGTDAETDPDVHLDANSAEGEAAVTEEGATAETPKVTGSERRRAALAALEREQNTRAIETNLIAERSRREALEGKLKNASLGELLALRGFNRDDALETLIAGKEGKSAEEQMTPEQRESARMRSEVDQIKKERDAEKAENARLQRQGNLNKVATLTQEIDSVPVVHAAIRHGVIVDHDEKTGAPLTAAEWIGGLAEAEWLKAGSPAGKQNAYLRAAAEVLEDKLMADHDPIAKAIEAKRTPARPATPATPPRPASLRRPAPRPDARPAPLPRDRDALDMELKRRFNLR